MQLCVSYGANSPPERDMSFDFAIINRKLTILYKSADNLYDVEVTADVAQW